MKLSLFSACFVIALSSCKEEPLPSVAVTNEPPHVATASPSAMDSKVIIKSEANNQGLGPCFDDSGLVYKNKFYALTTDEDIAHLIDQIGKNQRLIISIDDKIKISSLRKLIRFHDNCIANRIYLQIKDSNLSLRNLTSTEIRFDLPVQLAYIHIKSDRILTNGKAEIHKG